MRISEKLRFFTAEIRQQAHNDAAKEIDRYEESLSKDFKKWQVALEKDYNQRLIEEKRLIQLENNKQLAQVQIKQQENIYQKEEEFKQSLFDQFEQALVAYTKTDDYYRQLSEMIRSIERYAGQEAIIIYVSKDDFELRDQLNASTPHDVEVSDFDFMGGIRAIIEERNVLIDYSFKSYFDEARDNFSIQGGGSLESND